MCNKLSCFRVCSFGWKGLRERERIDLSEFEGEDYVLLFKGFGSDNIVNLRVNFVKVCERFYRCD